ncbi:hypothetical protein K2173_002452 [Erythroxylum novogranatense]|uniref:J domain-containing protein n=1 Tax=Erythroxylum novogranatense TaxID=1862640 RepID=A0AAV8TBA7_9ROSI|nr:hypothetical protein K2173_002452 [Erythroxylum novogranatense]
MASTTASQASCSLLLDRSPNGTKLAKQQVCPTARGCSITARRRRRRRLMSLGVRASQEPTKRQRAPPGVDTRIHWDNPDEGWIGGSSGSKKTQNVEEEQGNLLADQFADLLNDSTDSHYQFLGVPVEADMEEIKAAYRRLSKEYHPDTTSLPLKAASDKFMKLREVYDVLSDDEKRNFYDWTLAQEAASRQAEKLRMKLEDPYTKDVENYKSVPDMVDRLGGRNLDLSDQAVSALTVDVFVILFAIACIAYVIIFKEPYY